MGNGKSSIWYREPVRVIHGTIAVLVIIAAVAGDLGNALNGTQTWTGAGIAVGTVIIGEITRTRVSPAAQG